MNKPTPRRQKAPSLTQIASIVAASCAAMWGLPSQAQTANAADTPAGTEASSTSLDRVVITGTSQRRSKMRSSVSVTDVDQEQIKDFGVRSEAEVLLLIPGIRTEPTAGPGGNSNISVRGLPIASGGSKYVQLQEDGLPTVQFGDMNFSNNDYWIRFDNNVETIQTLRGGSASVFASHAPGAVINYISKTGKEKGGSVGLTRGLNFNETRLDGDFGTKLAPDLYFHVGGYFRTGEGARDTQVNTLKGYQLKGNITKEFNGGKGYVRAYVKLLDEHAPTTPQTFLKAKLNGNTYTGFEKAPGYDGTRDSQYSTLNGSQLSLNPATRAVTTSTLLDGISVNSKSLGLEFHNEMAGFTVDNKFRYSDNGGAFQAQFWDMQTVGNLLGTSGNTARYFNGPKAGTVVTDANLAAGLVSKGAAINVQTPDMGNLVNDLSLSKQFKLGMGTLDVKGGWFHSRQNVVQTWAINERVMEVGRNGALIDLYDAGGAALTSAGLTGYNNQWGCCARNVDAKFTTDAPYLSLNLGTGNLDIDAGLRRETFRAQGNYAGHTALPGGLDVNGDGQINGAETNVFVADMANPGKVDYKINYTSYSLGLNYRVNNDLSVFVRHSKGNRAMSDRLLFTDFIIASTGKLTDYGKTIAAAPVKQSELGLKFRGTAGIVNYNVAATVFHSTTEEFDYDQTRQDDPNKPNFQGPKLDVKGYKASGVELETGGAIGNLGLNINVVYSDEQLASSLFNAAAVGKTEGGVPKWRYTISPRYAIGDAAVVGATIRGQSRVYADGNNVRTIDGHYIVNAFVNYEFAKGMVASLNINNLFDKVYPTGGGGFVGGSSTLFGAGVETGRTISASVRYNF